MPGQAAPTTPVEVVRALSALTERLYEHVRVYSDAEKQAAVLRHNADMVEAKAFLRAEGSMELRKMTARVAAETAEEQALVAEAVVRTYKAKIKAIEVDIDVHRTYSATVRAELNTMGYDPNP